MGGGGYSKGHLQNICNKDSPGILHLQQMEGGIGENFCKRVGTLYHLIKMLCVVSWILLKIDDYKQRI